MAEPRPRSTDMYSDSFMLRSVAPRYVYCKHQATDLSSKILHMKTKDEIRYENLVALVEEAAGPSRDHKVGLTKLVKKAKERGKSLSRPYLYQVLTQRKTIGGTTRNIGDDVARKIEDALRLNSGWMDTDHENGSQNKSAPSATPDEFADLILHYGKLHFNNRMRVMSFIKELIKDDASDVAKLLDLLQVADDKARKRLVGSMLILARDSTHIIGEQPVNDIE